MSGYFSHIANRAKGLPSGNHLLHPPVSRNPFALRERTTNSSAEAGEHPGSSAAVVEKKHLVRPPQPEETTWQSATQPHSPPIVPSTQETPIHPQSVPVRKEAKEKGRMLAGEEIIQTPQKAFSIRYSVEKTESIQPAVQEPGEQPRKQVSAQESHSQKKERPQLVPIGTPVAQKPEAPLLKPRIMPRIQAQEVQPQSRPQKAQAQPKLVIGKLTVEVVQQQPPAVQTVAREPRETKPQTQTTQNGSNHRYKLKFGLGQL